MLLSVEKMTASITVWSTMLSETLRVNACTIILISKNRCFEQLLYYCCIQETDRSLICFPKSHRLSFFYTLTGTVLLSSQYLFYLYKMHFIFYLVIVCSMLILTLQHLWYICTVIAIKNVFLLLCRYKLYENQT